ncbi:hypothetical protein E5676_scaffold600G00830 [Cucumis melo var. makuwa]|uniref:Uncharacterized protein n=1 Tax=Cucumis melo var. makuwa TaxID=1194695 RepID=A0A5A7U4I9_CUCMM|nr:hypothetical protein E6C27_scaffold61G00860 [Cucumis melo var. makuwa]TYK28274.1 hypothetical protein E5676_scaffold600G00830 [Cucumis melo var. makuwa]
MSSPVVRLLSRFVALTPNPPNAAPFRRRPLEFAATWSASRHRKTESKPSKPPTEPGNASRAPVPPSPREVSPTCVSSQRPEPHPSTSSRTLRACTASRAARQREPNVRVSRARPCRAVPSTASLVEFQLSRFTSNRARLLLLEKRVFLLLELVEQISSVSSVYTTDQFVLGVPLGHRRPDFVPTGAHVAHVRERASYWAGAEVRARASWGATRSDRGEP